MGFLSDGADRLGRSLILFIYRQFLLSSFLLLAFEFGAGARLRAKQCERETRAPAAKREPELLLVSEWLLVCR